jgi:hypothetical protein
MQAAALRPSAALSGQCQAILTARTLRTARSASPCTLPLVPRTASQLPTFYSEEPSTSSPLFCTPSQRSRFYPNAHSAGLQNVGGKRRVVMAAQATSVATPAAGSEKSAQQVGSF